MRIVSTLRAKRDEIAAAIGVRQVEMDAARVDLAALDTIIKLFDPEAGHDEAAWGFRIERLGEPDESLAQRRRSVEDEEAPADGGELSGVRLSRGREALAAPAREPRSELAAGDEASAPGERIPGEFFYLHWP